LATVGAPPGRRTARRERQATPDRRTAPCKTQAAWTPPPFAPGAGAPTKYTRSRNCRSTAGTPDRPVRTPGTAGTPDRLVRTAGNTESPAPHSSAVDQHYLADHLIPGQLGKGLLGLIEGVGPGHQRFQLSGFEQG